MKRKFKILSTLIIATGLIIGWNLQSKPLVEALLGSNTLVSKNSTGGSADSGSDTPSLSNDGRYIAFASYATNLVTNDTNGLKDVFLRDLVTNTNTRVNVSSSGSEANGSSERPVISGDGKYVVYTSSATNLVTTDINGKDDVFRYNVSAGTTEIVSTDSSGTQGNGHSRYPDLDSEGRFIVFDTEATNLASITDTNSARDVILKDMSSGTVTHISQSDSGTLGNAWSATPKISCDGRYIGFGSDASNLTSDTVSFGNVFITDMLGTRTVKNITKSADAWSLFKDISCDGKYILLQSHATNLGVNPTPGTFSMDVYRYNRLGSSFDGVSTKQDGTNPTGASDGIAISSDGRYVIFSSGGASFVTSSTDSNNSSDLFLRDMNSTGFRIISQTPSGVTGSHGSNEASFSGTNRIVFSSRANNLVSGLSDPYNYDIFMVDAGTPNTCTF